MFPKILFIIGVSIFGVLGLIHLSYIYFTHYLMPRDRELTKSMKKTQVVLTKETNVFKAWVGFNVSHALGLIFFSLIYLILLTWSSFNILESKVFNLLALTVALFYVVLSKKYWFRVPLVASLIAFLCLLSSFILSL